MSTQLNPSQIKAVQHEKGPLLIVAGAGTGKTSVITQRILHLIRDKKLSPDNILALTFTDKAASEMVTRMDEEMPLGYIEPWIMTFHGFCDRILKTEGIEIGLSPDYEILTQTQAWILLHDNIFNLGLDYYAPLNNPNKFIHELIKFFSRLQDEDVNQSEIEKSQKSKIKSQNEESMELYQKYEELYSAYKKYQQLKLEKNVLDFGDLISWTLRLFRERKSILKKYQTQFKHILVDEFQDTNFSQLQLIKLLAPPEQNPNLTVVGDDDQAIYAFRGSSVHNILEFKENYPNASEILLTTNYRSGQPVLNAAYNSIILNNPDRLEVKLSLDKRLVAARGSKLPNPSIIEVDSLERETEFVIEKILELVGKDFSYKDVAILARANSHLEPFVSALRCAGLPYQLIGNRGLFDQQEVRDLLFFLKIAVNPYDSTSLFYFLHIENFQLASHELLELLNQSKSRTKPLWDIVAEKAGTDSRYKLIVDLVAKTQEADTKKTITDLVYQFIQTTGYINAFLKEESIENQLKIKNINLFFEKLKAFDKDYPKASVAQANEYFDLLLEAGENPAQAEIEDIDTVSLLTVHSAKGLEWPIVFLINMVSDRFPSRTRSEVILLPDELVKQKLPEGDVHLQEERRLFYVAVTRARDYLFAVYGRDYGGQRPKKPSVFLNELGVKAIKWEPKAQLSWLSQLQGVKAPKPRIIVDGQFQLRYVSYSQIDTYKSCPLKYKYQYVLNVPTKPHHAFAFGSTIHLTLQKFHQFSLHGQIPSLDTLLHMYESFFIDVGYDSQEQRMKRFESGKKALEAYYKNYQKLFLGNPVKLETKFKIMIDGIPMIGRIDRIDKLDYGYELIDYKTGNAKDQKTVDKDAQLTIYAMASQSLLGQLPQSLTLYYIESGSKFSTTRTQSQIDKKKEEILVTVEQIKKGDFEATPGFPMPCGYCPYNQICPKAKRG